VTGASSGLGDQFARILAFRGHDLVLVARDQARLEALAKELETKYAIQCEVLPADLTDRAQLAKVEARATSVDVLVNNAGFGTYGSFAELDVDTEAREVDLNCTALVRLSHAAATGMVERGKGGILNVSSVAGFQATPNDATYCATKAFVMAFSESIHAELKRKGVSVSCLCPGFTRTEFQERAGWDSSKVPSFAWSDAEEVARAGLDGLAKNKAIVVPGAVNKVTATFSSVAPRSITRRVAGMVAGGVE
jgi:short-subunit dehydrogenase